MPWRRSTDGDRQSSDAESSAKPTSSCKMKTKFEVSYLSADAVACSVEQIVTLAQKVQTSQLRGPRHGVRGGSLHETHLLVSDGACI